MNRKTVLATVTTIVAMIGAGSALAVEATQDFANQTSVSSTSRADVRAELQSAQRAGTIGYGEASPAPVAASTVTRTQVLAETQEAQRLGLVGGNEAGMRVASAAEQEAIRMAGLRAVETSVARNTR